MPESNVNLMHEPDTLDAISRIAEEHWEAFCARLRTHSGHPMTVLDDPELRYHMAVMEAIHPAGEDIETEEGGNPSVRELAREQEERDREDDRRAWNQW